MKKKYIFLLITLVYVGFIQAQTKNKKGYYIDNNGVKKEGLIKDLDWGITPTSFIFYTSEDSEGKTITLNNASVFSIYDVVKYERHQINIDQSSNKLNDLGRDRNPAMRIETLFLKVELEGNVKIYSHTGSNGSNFFYQKEGELIEPLIYKRYLTYDNKIKENNYYQQQLTSTFTCEGLSYNTANLSYKKNDIIKYIEKYNTCKGETSVRIEKKEKSSPFNLHLLAGANFNSFKIKESGNRNFDFGSAVNPVFGFELEFILPSNNNKWSAFIDGRYTSFDGEGSSTVGSATTDEIFEQDIDLTHNNFDVSFGIRHYLYLNKISKIHFGISYGLEFVSNTEAIYTISDDFTESNGAGSLGLAAGFSVHNFRGEIRYNTQKDHISSKSEYSSIMLTLSYNILQF